MSILAAIERRRAERVAVRVDVECRGYGRRIVSQISDLSIEGGYVDTLNPFPVGTTLEMMFAGREEGLQIHAQGVVRHSRPGTGMGIEFLPLSDEAIRGIDKLLRRYVLIADDDDICRTFLKLYFVQRGCVVRLAKHCLEVQELAEREAFDLVLTDGLMPHKHGFELSRLIKSRPQGKRTKIIVMTAIHKSDLYRFEAPVKFNADAYLRKPFIIEELNSTVNALLGF